MWLERDPQLGDVVTLSGQALEDSGVDKRVHGARATENPQVLPVRMTNDRISVLGVEIDDPVVAPERPEEGHLEFGFALAISYHVPT